MFSTFIIAKFWIINSVTLNYSELNIENLQWTPNLHLKYYMKFFMLAGTSYNVDKDENKNHKLYEFLNKFTVNGLALYCCD